MLSDTAGLRESADRVESIGVARARGTLEESHAVLWVIDGSAPIDAADHEMARAFAGKRVLVALNKSDLGAAVAPRAIEPMLGDARWTASVAVSAARGDGLGELRDLLARLIEATPADAASPGVHCALSNPRHVDALRSSRAQPLRAACRVPTLSC